MRSGTYSEAVLVAEIQRLRQELSLAEEGLANYAQEVEELRKAIRAAHSRVQGYRGGSPCSCAYCAEHPSTEPAK